MPKGIVKNVLLEKLVNSTIGSEIVVDKNIRKEAKQLLNELDYRKPKVIAECIVLANDDTYPLCPRCDYSGLRDYQEYCCCCGQRLKWGSII